MPILLPLSHAADRPAQPSADPVDRPMPPRLNALPRAAARKDPTQLRLHRAHCAAARSQLHGLRGAVDAVDTFLSPRFFSTLAVLSVLGLALAWWLA